MGQALYRKYRPRAFADIIGQEHVTQTLSRAIQAGNIGHAYLFTGPKGTGKTSVARILAYQINKLPYGDTVPLDIIEIDAASNRRIDDIRDLREKVHITPVSASYKIYIIDEVHMLTGESFNALLKTLEEPPSHVVFILATTEVHKLPATIISRTQRFAFKPVSNDKVVAHLRTIAQQEKIHIDNEALDLIGDHGEGSFRDSISLLDQMAHVSNDTITVADVTRILGLAPQTELNTLIRAILAKDRHATMTILADLESAGASHHALINQLCRALIQHAPEQPDLYQLVDRLLDVPRAYNPSLKLLSTLAMFTTLIAAQGDVKNEPKNAALTIAAAPPISITKKPDSPSKSAAAQTPKPARHNPAPSASAATPMAVLTADDWQKVLVHTQKKNPPLYSVLKQALPSLKDGALVLTFKYKLHSKKLEDTKQKVQLAGIIATVLGTAPVIQTVVNKNPAPLAHDPAVASITAIMGGGELLHAEKL